MSPDPLWDAYDVADYLKVSVHTVRKWRQHNKVPYMKINGSVRYKPTEIIAWAEAQAMPA